MTSQSLIIFGSTGHVGSAVARNIRQFDNKNEVYLAMRDTQKHIHGLDSNEQDRNFTRAQADLTDAQSIQDAVDKSNAKRAFIYLAHGTSDNMRASIEALKAGGVEFVVFLSSAAVRGDIRSVPPEEFIAHAHAQVEINLEEVFGQDGYVAVRPAFFANNIQRWNSGIKSGNVRMAFPDAKMDWITPEDIGRLCAAFLAGTASGVNVVRLVGPKLMSLREAIEAVGRATGKDLKITEVDEEEGVKIFQDTGMAPPIAKMLISMFKDRSKITDNDAFYDAGDFDKSADNMRKYTGTDLLTFEEWAANNPQEFE